MGNPYNSPGSHLGTDHQKVGHQFGWNTNECVSI